LRASDSLNKLEAALQARVLSLGEEEVGSKGEWRRSSLLILEMPQDAANFFPKWCHVTLCDAGDADGGRRIPSFYWVFFETRGTN
jgi:hypothetical protein